MFRFLQTKKGFTLVELLVVVAIVGILVAVAVPIYNSVTRSGRIRTCSVMRREIVSQAKNWSMDNDFNQNFDYKIISDGTKGTITSNTISLSQEQITLLTTDVHPNLRGCPASGTFIVTLTPQINGIPKVVVTCDGGDDGDCHKDTL